MRFKEKGWRQIKGVFYKNGQEKKFNTAVATLAHKMLYTMWFMLTNNEGSHDGEIQVDG